MPSRVLVLCVLPLFCGATVHAQQVCNDRVNQTAPASRFVDNGNGTVTDSRTGLMWQRCMMGYTFSNNGTPGTLTDDSCAASATVTFLWQQALRGAVDLNAQGGFGGFSDWRLPNIKELISIVEHKCTSPAINETIFPDTPPTAQVFSSSPGNDGVAKTTVMTLDMRDGQDDSTEDAVVQTALRSVRLVRATN
jgi:Protein of unknown function (DUF1566)